MSMSENGRAPRHQRAPSSGQDAHHRFGFLCEENASIVDLYYFDIPMSKLFTALADEARTSASPRTVRAFGRSGWLFKIEAGVWSARMRR